MLIKFPAKTKYFLKFVLPFVLLLQWTMPILEKKRNIHFNNSTMFKRFEWIKRNRDNENLNSFNINLKSYNPILASLTNKLQASLNNNSSNFILISAFLLEIRF